MFRTSSVSAKIAISMGILILVVCAGLGVLAYRTGHSAVISEVEQALKMQAEEASTYVERGFEVQLSILETIAARPDIQSMDWQTQRLVIQAESDRLPQFLAIGIIDHTGLMRYADGSSLNVSDYDYVKGVLQGRSVVSDLIVSPLDNSTVLMYAAPIKRNGQVVGAVIGRRDGATLSTITDRLGFGENGWAYMLSDDGTIIAHPDRQYVIEEENVFNPTSEFKDIGQELQNLGLGNTGIIRYKLSDGAQRIIGVAPIASTGWTINVGAMENDVLGNIKIFRTFLLWISILFIAIGTVVAVVLGRQIANPLVKVQEIIEGLAGGDLTRTANVTSNDETGRVAAALNTTIGSLAEVIALVSSTTISLAGTSVQMAAASQEVSASVEEVASTTNEFSSTLDVMNTNSQAMSATVEGISKQAEEGEDAIQDIVNQMSALRNNTQQLANEVSELGSVSGQIGNIVSTITDIAEQTNLLALNAAIEAARAGDHGRGFAVVADEVRGLAEQSATATAEITTLISQVQTGIEGAVTGMSAGAEQADRALVSVNQSGELLQSILGAVDTIAEQMQELAIGLSEVNHAGHEIASATEEQAASIEQVAASAQSLTDMGTQLKNLVERFKLED